MNSPKDDNRRSFQQLSSLLSAGMVFPVATAIGYGVGYFLDRLFGTTYLTIVFLLFGIAAGFVSFFRAISAAEAEDPDTKAKKPPQ
jgi:F0F1-type ATP synthase assembly protein I